MHEFLRTEQPVLIEFFQQLEQHIALPSKYLALHPVTYDVNNIMKTFQGRPLPALMAFATWLVLGRLKAYLFFHKKHDYRTLENITHRS